MSRSKRARGHSAAGAAVAAGRAGGKVQMGAAQRVWSRRGGGRRCERAQRTNGVQGESSTLQEQYIAGEVGPHGGKMELVGRFSKFWTEKCWKCDGRDTECEPCDGDGTWDVKRYKGKGEEYSKQYSGQASSTVQQASKGLSGEVQSQAGTAPHRTGIGRQTYASAARAKTSGGANQTTAGDGRRGK